MIGYSWDLTHVLDLPQGSYYILQSALSEYGIAQLHKDLLGELNNKNIKNKNIEQLLWAIVSAINDVGCVAGD
jgi:hypothetical protein